MSTGTDPIVGAVMVAVGIVLLVLALHRGSRDASTTAPTSPHTAVTSSSAGPASVSPASIRSIGSSP